MEVKAAGTVLLTGVVLDLVHNICVQLLCNLSIVSIKTIGDTILM